MEEKYYCSQCNGVRNHKKLFEEKTSGDEEWIQWIHRYIVMKCLGCDNVSFLSIYGDSEMTYHTGNGEFDYYDEQTIYPYYLDGAKEIEDQHLLPRKIRVIYEETINCLKADLAILSAGGFRAIIEAVCNNLKIKKGNLANRIDQLHSKGYLTAKECKRLHSIRFIGNDALHEIDKPKFEHLYVVLDIINHLLENLYVNDKKLKEKLDYIVDSFDEVVILLGKCIDDKSIGDKKSLKEILGKSIRLIPSKKIDSYEKTLIEEITNEKIKFLKLVSDKSTPVYEILSNPLKHPFGLF